MEKCIGLIMRPGTVDRADFLPRLLAAMVTMPIAQVPSLRRLIVNVVDVDPPPGAGAAAPRYDAVVELWLDRLDDPGAWALAGEMAGGGTACFYHVAERVQMDHGCTWGTGERSPGVKAIYVVRRPVGLDAREAARRWREHAPLARTHHAGMWKYVQNGVIAPLTEGAPVVHGIAELHFPTRGDFEQRMYDSDAGRETITADAARMVGEAIPLYTSEYILHA